MKRRVMLLLLLLLTAGAVINIAVGWGCVLRNGEFTTRNADSSESARRLERVGYDTMPNSPASEARGFGTRTLTLVGFKVETEVKGITLYVLEAGWPTFSLSEEWHRVQVGRAPATQTLRGGWALWNEDFPRRIALPFRPLWAGFAINTVFYAAVLGMLFTVLVAMRRRRRIRRGLCPKCAYDLRGLTSVACPECGSE